MIWQVAFSNRDTLLSTFLAASHNAHGVTNFTSSLVLYRRPHISEPRLEGESIRQHTTCLQTAQNNHPAAVVAVRVSGPDRSMSSGGTALVPADPSGTKPLGRSLDWLSTVAEG